MDRRLSHDELAELLGAFALDAVEADEAAAVEEHVRGCPRCAAEVAEHRAVAGLIANAGVEAPADLWERIAARAGARGQPTPPAGPARTGLRPPAGTARRRPTSARVAWGAVAALSAAAVAVIAVLGVQVDHLDQKVQALSASGQAAATGRAVQAALLDPAATRVSLERTASSALPRQALVLVILPDGSAYALNTGLPRLGTEKTYQLWGFVGGRPVSLGLLGPDPAQVPFSVDPAAGVRTFAVTAEAAGGSVAPSGRPVAETARTA